MSILDVSSFDTSEVEDMSVMFRNCQNLRSLSVSKFNTSKVTNMTMMFMDCGLLSSIDLSNFDTSNVTNMGGMFARRNVKNLNISNFDFSNVENISYMFEENPYLNTSFTLNFDASNGNYNSFLRNAAQYGQVNIRLDCGNYSPANIESVLATANYSNRVNVTEVSCPAKHTITVSDSTVTPSLSRAYPGTNITLKAQNKKIVSFKMNGTLINDRKFTMPSINANVTDIELTDQIYVESEHNPYANNIDNVVYYENTFPGATSIEVILNYATESTSYDWVYVYGSSSTFGKYGGFVNKGENLTTNITVPGNYIKIVFRTDNIVNEYYGFDATIAPVY